MTQEQNAIKNYHDSVRRIVELFFEKQLDKEEFDEFDYDDDVAWVGGRPAYIGTCFSWADYHINFSDIVIDITSEAPKGLFFEWYDYTMESVHNRINYNSWVMGLRPEDEQAIKAKKLSEAKERLEVAKLVFEAEMRNYEKLKITQI